MNDPQSSIQAATSPSCVRQTCDQCFARRKKCNRQDPCDLCIKSDLECTFTKQHKRRGRKGKIVEQFKRKPKSDDGCLEPVTVASWDTSTELGPLDDLEPLMDSDGNLPLFDFGLGIPVPGEIAVSASSSSHLQSLFDPMASSSSSVALPNLAIEQAQSLIRNYFDHIHPCYPLVEKDWFTSRFITGEAFDFGSENHFRNMVLSLCGLAMAFVSHVLRTDESDAFKRQTTTVMTDVVSRHYMQPMGGEKTTIEQVITAFHIGLYFSIVHGDKAGHFRLAEAAHLAKSMGLHDPATYADLDVGSRRRRLSVLSCVFSTNRACELRQGWSEIIPSVQQLGAVNALVFPQIENTSMADDQWQSYRHLNHMIGLFDIVDPAFSRCARDQCDLDTCHLSARDIIRYAQHLDRLETTMPVMMYEWSQPYMQKLEEVRWIEFMIGHRWLAAHVWHIALRHSIDMATLEGGKFAMWPLGLLSEVRRILTVSNIRSVQALGNGLVARLIYIMTCGLDFMNRHLLDAEARHSANADIVSVMTVIQKWDSKMWTRCLL